MENKIYDEFYSAKEEELNKWKEFGAYEPVKYDGQDLLSGRWITTNKAVGSVIVKKARYVIKGFLEESSFQSDSPTGSKESFRLILSILASKGWGIHSIDVKSAFLQGKRMDRDIFIKPPREAKEEFDNVWRLNKSIYGLNDAARNWYFSVYEELCKYGCKRSTIDYGLFMWYDKKKKIYVVYYCYM